MIFLISFLFFQLGTMIYRTVVVDLGYTYSNSNLTASVCISSLMFMGHPPNPLKNEQECKVRDFFFHNEKTNRIVLWNIHLTHSGVPFFNFKQLPY